MREMTARAFLDLMAGMRGMRDRSRMLELVDMFGLDLRARIGGMSKGNRQKVAIVAAFMARPDVLLLDEPTSGLDPLMQERFLDLVAQERARGAAVLLSSHIFEEVGARVRPGGVHPRGAGGHDLHHGRGPLDARPRLHGRVRKRAGAFALGARPRGRARGGRRPRYRAPRRARRERAHRRALRIRRGPRSRPASRRSRNCSCTCTRAPIPHGKVRWSR